MQEQLGPKKGFRQALPDRHQLQVTFPVSELSCTQVLYSHLRCLHNSQGATHPTVLHFLINNTDRVAIQRSCTG